MRDRQKCIPQDMLPVANPEDAVFSPHFLLRLSRVPMADAFRTVGQFLAEALNNAGEWGTEDESMTVLYLRSAAADLRHLSALLTVCASSCVTSSLPADEVRLALLAARWATKARKLAVAIEKTLAA